MNPSIYQLEEKNSKAKTDKIFIEFIYFTFIH